MRFFLICIVILSLFSCEKDKIENLDCEKFQTGLLSENEQVIKDEIEKISSDLDPVPNAEDLIGHNQNLQSLIERINSSCSSLHATTICYACIETFPQISEIKIELTLNGVESTIIIDLYTPKDDILRYARIHVD